jgi:hypothetical protein
MERGSRRRAAAGEPPISREPIVRHGQPEQRGQEHAPRISCPTAKETTGHVGVVQRVENVHGLNPAA